MESRTKTALTWTSCGYVCLLLLMVCLDVGHLISLRQMAIGVGISSVLTWVLAMIIFERGRGSRVVGNDDNFLGRPTTGNSVSRAIHRYEIALALLTVIFIYEMWQDSDYPVWVNLVRGLIGIGGILALLRVIQVKKAKLKN